MAIMYDVKKHKGVLSKLSGEILSVLAFLKPLSDFESGEYYVAIECKNNVSTSPKQLTIREIEKSIIQTDSDFDLALYNKKMINLFCFK